jgi:hypothetical protein
MKDILELYCLVDDFCKEYSKYLLAQQHRKPTRICKISVSVIITIILLYQRSNYRDFKNFYINHYVIFCKEFAVMPCYSRFVELMKRTEPYFEMLLQWLCLQVYNSTEIAYIDATSISVCTNKRTSTHQVFRGIAKIGKTTKGWFYGLKLHIIINEKGELMNFIFSSGNVDDRAVVPDLTHRLTGLLLGDKGYISQNLSETLYNRGLKILTGIKKNMQNKLISIYEKMLLQKRNVVESVFNILKNHFKLEHTRHRSPINACVHLLSTLVAYCLKNSKPHINFSTLINP